MKFNDYKYERPDYEKSSELFTSLLDELEKASDKNSFYETFMKLNALKTHINTMSALAYARHTVNTKDEFYDQENDYWNETRPLYSVYDNRLARICSACSFKEELYDLIPEVYFKLQEYSLKSFDEKVVPLLQKQNRLSSEYGKLKANAQIPYEGKIYNLSTISPFTMVTDREVRKKASDAKYKFYQDNEAEFDRIYDELVKVRTQIAKELGYQTYTELAYYMMSRIDYNQEMVANYRKQILEHIVPVAAKLAERKRKRLGLEKVTYYDSGINFLSGNPLPKGNAQELIAKAQKMYHEMSPETAEFIDVMVNDEIWDLESKDGKEMGGYCLSLDEFEVPFIFANFNGTSGDVDVLTHEAGHAFQYYCSRKLPIFDLHWATMESSEIHSMTMEFNAWPWMKDFFEEDETKYKFLHLGGTINFLPYGVLVDHFQHEVYNHPEMSPEERKACWKKLQALYMPYADYEGCEILEKGCWWYQQGHIFESPFYYIDYTLAQVCALQFWVRQQNNDPKAWSDYLHLCQLGGTLSFTGLVKEAGLKVPFEDGCIASVVKDIEAYLDNIDDLSL